MPELCKAYLSLIKHACQVSGRSLNQNAFARRYIIRCISLTGRQHHEKRVPVPSVDPVESRILTIRRQKVILDADLAAIYGVTTKRLNEQVKRNGKRFPADFVFRLTPMEKKEVVANCDHLSELRFSPVLPYAFTESGAIMAANILSSTQAVRMSVFVVRAFVRMRELMSGSKELAAELKKLEAKLTTRLDVHETAIVDVLQRIMRLLDPPPGPPLPEKSMGFHTTMKQPARRSG